MIKSQLSANGLVPGTETCNAKLINWTIYSDLCYSVQDARSWRPDLRPRRRLLVPRISEHTCNRGNIIDGCHVRVPRGGGVIPIQFSVLHSRGDCL
jgi:hypothetical protein